MPTIEHQDQEGEVIVWTYPASGDRYSYIFNGKPLELHEKFHVTNPATSEEKKKRVAPNVTPAVRDYLQSEGYELA